MSFVSRYELTKAYHDCIQKKRGTVNAINFEVNESLLLNLLYKQLNTMTYKIGKSVVFVLKDHMGNPYREVFAADFVDRIVHHLFINRILSKLEQYEFIEDNYACRKEKGTLYGALRCKEHMQSAYEEADDKNEVYVIKGDLQNCFNTLNKILITNIICDFIDKHLNDRNAKFNKWLAKIIIMHCPQYNGNYIRKQPKSYWVGLPNHKSLFNCDDNYGIAVGNLTSQIFANTLLSKFDHFVTDVLGYKHYGRYVDDFYIIGFNKEKMLQDYKKIKKYLLNELELKVSENKFYIQTISKGVKFVGYMIYRNRIYINNRTKNKFNKKVHDWDMYLKENFYDKRINIDLITTLDIIKTWNAYVGMFMHVYGSRNIILSVLKKNPYFVACMQNVTTIRYDNFILTLTKDMKHLQMLYLGFGITTITKKNPHTKWIL